MVIVDRQGKILVFNAQTETLFGYTRQELLGLEVEVLIPKELRSKHPARTSDFANDPWERAMSAGRELHGLRRDGSRFPVEIGLNPSRSKTESA